MFDMPTPPAGVPLDTPEDVRTFLRNCLAREGRRPNTPRSLHLVMPDWLRNALHAHAPHLAALLADADRLHAAENAAHDAYAEALAAWIEDTPRGAQTATSDVQAPPVVVAVTRYAVSLFPPDSRDHRYYALHVELRPRGWIVTNGFEYFGPDGIVEQSQSTAHHFPHDDHQQALALAARLAPDVDVNGITAADVYRRTHTT
jgi:hypothetical protein